MDVTIVGGGVIGLAAAYYLQQEGYAVTVIDSGDLTDGCSFGNMGYVSPSHFVPLATPGIISQGIKWMLDASSPFYIKPRMNMDLLRWGWHFYRSANAATLNRQIPYLNNLLQFSRQLMAGLGNDLGNSFSFTQTGCWMLYKNKKTGEHEKHLSDKARELGLKTVVCNASEVQQYEKEVEVNVAGGILYLDDAYVDPAQLMQALYQFLVRKGVQFHLNSTVTAFEQSSGRVTAAVTGSGIIPVNELLIANGSWMQDISKKLNIRLLMQPGKGYSFKYSGLQQNLSHSSILVDDRVATTPYGPVLRIGGTMELSGHHDVKLPKRIQAIYTAFKKYYPGMSIDAPGVENAWFGYRPVSPDGMPYIGRHPKFSNLTYAGGHAMLGVSAATGTGKLIPDIIGHRKPVFDITAFDPGRFG